MKSEICETVLSVVIYILRRPPDCVTGFVKAAVQAQQLCSDSRSRDFHSDLKLQLPSEKLTGKVTGVII